MAKQKENANINRLSLYTKVTSLLIGGIICIIFLGLLGGIIKTLADLNLLFKNTLEIALRQLLVNALILFAVVEVLKTALSYFSEGRVKVTFIIDTVLIIMLNEIMSFWFKGGQGSSFVFLIITILTLIIARILAIRFSPDE